MLKLNKSSQQTFKDSNKHTEILNTDNVLIKETEINY